MRKKQSNKRLLSGMTGLLIGVISFVLLLPRITDPYWGHHYWNGVWYGTIAKNYNRLGLVKTKGAQVLNSELSTDSNSWVLHKNHPATYSILLALWWRVVGESEATGRLLSVISTTAGMVGLYALGRRLSTNTLVASGVVVLMLTPLLLYYGKMPVSETLIFPTIAWGLYFYWNNMDRKIDKSTPIFVFASLLLDWPGFWFGFWILVIELVFLRRKMVVFGIIACIALAATLILGHQMWVTGSLFDDFEKIGVQRFAAAHQPYTTVMWIRTLVSRVKAFIGLPILVATALGSLFTMYFGRKHFYLMIVALLTGWSHIFIFRNITWYHDYMLYHSIPFFGLALVIFLETIVRRFGNGKTTVAVILVLALATFVSTNKFYVALADMQPHRKCVEFGKSLKMSDRKLRFTGTMGEVNGCGPFIGFYGEKSYLVDITDD